MLRWTRSPDPVLIIAAHDALHILFGSGEADLLSERLTVCCRSAAEPFEHIAAAGVVICKGVGNRIVSLAIALQKFLEIPCARQRICPRIKTIRMRETCQMLGIRPFLRRFFAKLHQPDLTGSPPSARMESAFPPHPPFDYTPF